MEKLAEDLFDPSISARDHAIFETGIKLSTLFHLMLGAPVKNDPEVLKDIAKGMEAAIGCQPFVKRVNVNLHIQKEGMSHDFTKRHEFDYTTISGKMIEGEVEVEYNGWIAIGRVEWNMDLYYPLMYIKEIRKKE